MILRNKPEYLYVHVPFCASICAYCDFAHTVYRTSTVRSWLDALRKEIQAKEIRRDLRTIYIGGGTPTSLSYEELKELLQMLSPYSEQVIEYTCEVNPETMDTRKAELMAEYGINRISIGYQCSQPELLKLLGRHHSAETVEETMKVFASCGIDNISLDLMYSLPTQTMDMLKESVEKAIAMNPDHLSLYSLTVEENTVFYKKHLSSLDEDTEADMYEYICSYLPKRGYEQYEISNFAKQGKQSLHNRAYWTYRDFTGISCGASGKEGMRRYDHTRSLKEYINDPLKTEDILLSKEDAMFEMVMMNLRLVEGMSLNLFEETFGVSFEDAFRGRYEEMIERKLLRISDGMIACTKKGYPILNDILSDLL